MTLVSHTLISMLHSWLILWVNIRSSWVSTEAWGLSGTRPLPIHNMDGFVQDSSIFFLITLEILRSYIMPSGYVCFHMICIYHTYSHFNFTYMVSFMGTNMVIRDINRGLMPVRHQAPAHSLHGRIFDDSIYDHSISIANATEIPKSRIKWTGSVSFHMTLIFHTRCHFNVTYGWVPLVCIWATQI